MEYKYINQSNIKFFKSNLINISEDDAHEIINNNYKKIIKAIQIQENKPLKQCREDNSSL